MKNRVTILMLLLSWFTHTFSQPICPPSGFQKKISGPGDDRAMDIKVTPYNEYLISGTTNSSTGSPGNFDALLFKLDPYGNEIWQVRFGGSNYENFSKILILRNGDYIVLGNTRSFHNDNGSLLFVRFDTTGNIQVQKELHLQAPSHIGTMNISTAIELQDGSIAFCGNAEGINTDVGQPLNAVFNIVGVLDKDGNVKWIKRMRMYYAESGSSMNGMVSFGNSLIAVLGNGLVRMSIQNGNLVGMQKQLQFLEAFNSIEKRGDQIIIYSSTQRIQLDTNLNVLGVVRFAPTSISEHMTLEGLSSPGSLGLQGTITKNGKPTATLISKSDAAGNINWTYLYPYPIPNSRRLLGSQMTLDNGVIAVGLMKENDENYAELPDIYIIRTDSAGRIPDCPRSGFQFSTVPINHEIWELAVRFYPINVSAFNLQLATTPSLLSLVDICVNDCQTLDLSGNDTLCNLQDTLKLTARKNAGCMAMTEWIVDSSYAKIISFNDSTISIVGKGPGQLMVRARTMIGCRIIEDSIPLNIFASPASINLGPDIQLCMIKSYQLKAAKGFRTYLWNDGSTDSMLTVTAAGRYIITATDYCGKYYRDTVDVTELTGISFDLGPNKKKCNEDSLIITAPSGYNSYRWGPDYNLLNSTSPTVKVFPDRDTMYTVVAEKSTGCFVTDSVYIKVNKSPRINLGRDTSFCQKDSIILDAGAGFDNYSWNTGSVASTIAIKQKGGYSVTATTTDGCVSRDELIIHSVFDLPAIELGPDTSYCRNQEFKIAVHPGYADYRWSNNASASTIRINSPGTYWLKVTSKEGCITRDTIRLSEKECTKGVYFPNAFTPNKDRFNNYFKPTVYGELEDFYMVVYNRWGQMVFDTRAAQHIPGKGDRCAVIRGNEHG